MTPRLQQVHIPPDVLPTQQSQRKLMVFVRKFLTAEALLALRQGPRAWGQPALVGCDITPCTLPCTGHRPALCSQGLSGHRVHPHGTSGKLKELPTQTEKSK